MKKLYVVRHAKSEWANSSKINDIDRPLNTRGVRDAYLMSSAFNEKAALPDLILSSSGIRALHTAIIFARQIGFDTRKIVVIPELYHAAPDIILNELKKVPEEINKVMLFAHNPGIADFTSFVHKEKYINIPTCTIVSFNYDAKNWESINLDSLSIESIESPKRKKKL